ncbi:MAG: ABC transporter ATP-binding protein, partial [Deltaproteobacteria bacterium]|nr:ABC transporter ATP-binding protein [Deltaproteobacteria bacterium]
EIQRRMNFSSTYPSLPFSLTAREALTVFARLYGVKNPGKKVREVAGIFGIDSLLDREIRTFSSGQQTRLNLAKAFINDPEILLLDEPTASLDPDVAERTRSFLREVIHSRKMSIIYTSHNMSEMEEMTSRIVFISEGKVVAEGSSNEIVSRFKGKNLEDVFLRIARRETDEH